MFRSIFYRLNNSKQVNFDIFSDAEKEKLETKDFELEEQKSKCRELESQLADFAR